MATGLNRTSVFGWGINDCETGLHYSGDTFRMYSVWSGMLERCLSERYQKLKPTYQGCLIADEWRRFSRFQSWMVSKDWEGKHLDKDLLGDGKLYSPGTCCFVEPWVNNLFLDSGRIRGEFPIGVSKQGKRYKAQIKINGKKTHIGMFDSPDEAHGAYCRAKLNHVRTLMTDYPDLVVKEAVLKKAEELLHG